MLLVTRKIVLDSHGTPRVAQVGDSGTILHASCFVAAASYHRDDRIHRVAEISIAKLHDQHEKSRRDSLAMSCASEK